MKKVLLALIASGFCAVCHAAAPSCDNPGVTAEAGRLAKEHVMDTYATTFSGYTGMTYADLKMRVQNGTKFLVEALQMVEDMGSKVSVDVSAARQVGESKGQTMCRAQFTVNRPDGSSKVSLQYAVFQSGGNTYVELYFR